jgi:hypothetical protein
MKLRKGQLTDNRVLVSLYPVLRPDLLIGHTLPAVHHRPHTTEQCSNQAHVWRNGDDLHAQFPVLIL